MVYITYPNIVNSKYFTNIRIWKSINSAATLRFNVAILYLYPITKIKYLVKLHNNIINTYIFYKIPVFEMELLNLWGLRGTLNKIWGW